MTKTEREALAILSHMSMAQRAELVRFSRGQSIKPFMLGKLIARGLVNRNEYGALCVTYSGKTIIRLMQEMEAA